MLEVKVGEYKQAVDAALQRMAEQQVIQRIWSHDHTVWKAEPTEITNRLGWLRIAEESKQSIDRMTGLADELRAAGYRKAVLLGMGGSSLAPEVFSKTFGPSKGYLEVSVIDSTDPQLILSYAEELDFSKTVFLVSTKSGGTVETLSFFKYLYNRIVQAVGADKAGEHFLAITDPGSKLADLAAEYKFRDTFLNNPDIGGRYSALSYFGLVPAALLGIDLRRLLERAVQAACGCGHPDCSGGATGLGELRRLGGATDRRKHGQGGQRYRSGDRRTPGSTGGVRPGSAFRASSTGRRG
jgi:glucose-6-phosphate isomerase